MVISIIDHGKSINWGTIMYYQLVKELIKWEKCQQNMIEEHPKENQKRMYAILP
jgi:hypothetical protein